MDKKDINNLYKKIDKLDKNTLKVLLKELLEEIKIDTLTNTYNRRILNDELNYSVIVMCDIDDFKKINDVYGHMIGDKILFLIADRLKELLSDTDIICRYGGDEFLIIFKNCSIEDVIKRIEDIKDNILEQNVIFKITMSFGLTKYEKDKSIEDAIKEADIALYSSKSNGKNRITNYDKIIEKRKSKSNEINK